MLAYDDVPGASAKRSKLFFKKKYPTLTDRKIVTDVSIETYISEEKQACEEWSTLIIFECKRYSNKVNIADLDEFESKLTKIGGYGVKGYFVTTSGFSRTAIQDARKYHYGLVVFGKDGNWKWEVPRDTRRGKNEEYIPVLTGESFVGTSPLIFDNGCFYNIVDSLQNNGVVFPLHRKIKIPYLPKERIKEIASQLYVNNPGIDEDIAGNLLFRLFPDFSICFDNLPLGVEGQTSLKEHKVILSNALLPKPERMRFTIAHELGHLVLHSDILAAYEGINGDKPHPLSESELHWMDYHANCFASYILMPSIHFYTVVQAVFQKFSINSRKFIVDKQPFKASLLQAILFSVASYFHVSKEAAFIRMKEENLIVDLRNNPKRLGDIFLGR